MPSGALNGHFEEMQKVCLIRMENKFSILFSCYLQRHCTFVRFGRTEKKFQNAHPGEVVKYIGRRTLFDFAMDFYNCKSFDQLKFCFFAKC